MRMPIEEEYKKFISLEEKINELSANNKEIPDNLYDDLEDAKKLVREHPDYETFHPNRIFYPRCNVIKDYFTYLLNIYSYSVLHDITLDMVRYHTYSYVKNCDIFSAIHRNVAKNGWDSEYLKNPLICEKILDNIFQYLASGSLIDLNINSL